MGKTIIYVHGASSTPESFNFISQNLPEHQRINFQYNCIEPIENIVREFVDTLPEEGEYSVIAHSLGGVVSVAGSYLLKEPIISKMAILSSPFGGSKIASYLKWMYPKYGLFDNVSVTNPLILTIKERGAIVPTLNIITNGGELPLIREKNDGVVSVASQMALKNCEKKIFSLNHFEVLLSYDVTKAIKEYLW